MPVHRQSTMEKMRMPNEEILDVLKNASDKRFWGQIQLDFKDGSPTLIRISETRKIQIDMEKNRQDETRKNARL